MSRIHDAISTQSFTSRVGWDLMPSSLGRCEEGVNIRLTPMLPLRLASLYHFYTYVFAKEERGGWRKMGAGILCFKDPYDEGRRVRHQLMQLERRHVIMDGSNGTDMAPCNC